MRKPPSRAAAPDVRGPWFIRRPRVALGVAALLYACVVTLRFTLSNPLDAISMLYFFPIALVAMTKGRRGGALGGVAAVVLIAVWVVARDVELGVIGWLSRVLPLLLIGPIVGDARDRLEGAASERLAHDVARQRHRQAIEINDSLVQGMAAAKWSIEAGRVRAGLEALNQTVEHGHRLVSELIRDAEDDAASSSVDGDDPTRARPVVDRSNVPPAGDPRL